MSEVPSLRVRSVRPLYIGVMVAQFALFSLFEVAFLRASPVSIAIIGDSITQADVLHYSFRYPLWKKLIDANIDFDFVGSIDYNYGGTPSYPDYLRQSFDRDHEGHGGWRADQILSGLPGASDPVERKSLANRVADHFDNPADIVLIHIGTNDMFQEQSVGGTVNEIEQIIDVMRLSNSNAKFLLAKLIPTTWPQNSLITSLNGQMDAIASAKSLTGSPVVVVDHNTGYNASDHNYDGTHPNSTGEELMAQRWLAGIELLLAQWNQPPAAYDDPMSGHESYYNADEDNAIFVASTHGVLLNDTDPDGDWLTAANATNTAHGTVSLYSDGSLLYLPDENYNGPDSFTYQAFDGTGYSNAATVNLTINAVNDIPVALDDPMSGHESYYSTDEDNALFVLSTNGVLVNDTDQEGDWLTAANASDTAHGTVSLYSDGSLLYVPDENYNGLDSFTYQAFDGTDFSNTATVTLSINAVNDLPVGENDAYDVPWNDVLTVSIAEGLLANDSDVDGDDLIVELLSGSDPLHGVLVLNEDGSLSYDPDGYYSGDDEFSYRVFDGTEYSDTVTCSLTVAAGQIPGDANGDGSVDVADLGILATNYGAGSGFGWGDGDFTGDGIVDVADLGILATNYGTVSGAVVPEPSTFAALLGLCLAGLLVSPRRKGRTSS